MSPEDSEHPCLCWKKLKTFKAGQVLDQTVVESLLRVESKCESDMHHERLESHRYELRPWNLRQMTLCMRCHLHGKWKDLENHKELEMAEEQQHAEQAAEEMQHADHHCSSSAMTTSLEQEIFATVFNRNFNAHAKLFHLRCSSEPMQACAMCQ
jgi:hypothetical protein